MLRFINHLVVHVSDKRNLLVVCADDNLEVRDFILLFSFVDCGF